MTSGMDVVVPHGSDARQPRRRRRCCPIHSMMALEDPIDWSSASTYEAWTPMSSTPRRARSRVQAATPIAQRADGTLLAPFRPMGRGATYTVVSRRVPVTAQLLRTAGRRAAPAVINRRVRPADRGDRARPLLARQLANGTTSSFDKVQAIERWLSPDVTYSIDAPLTPRGQDVVDDFLFRSHQGWCEQVASSLVVLLRAQGVPARLVTGFVPDEIDPISGSYTVREKDAHAWAEVYFPGVGWQAFDPTASVPLAGNAKHHSAASIWLRSGWLLVTLLVAGALLVSGPALLRLMRRLQAQRRRRTDARSDELAWGADAAAAARSSRSSTATATDPERDVDELRVRVVRSVARAPTRCGRTGGRRRDLRRARSARARATGDRHPADRRESTGSQGVRPMAWQAPAMSAPRRTKRKHR